jgi:hypothetical protein
MSKMHIAIAALIVGASGTANAFDIGHLTCRDIGQLAAQMAIARQSGVPAEAYLSALNQKLPPDATVERQVAVNIAKVVYQNEEIAAMQPKQVFAAFAQNCAQAQEQDQMSGQHEDGTSPDQEDNDTGDEDGQTRL